MSPRHRQAIAPQILRHALARGESPAISCAAGSFSFRALAGGAIAYAEHIQQLSLAANSRVALCIDQQQQFLAAFIGVRLCGHNALVINPEWPETARTHCLRTLQPALLLDNASAELIGQKSDDTDTETIQHWLERADQQLDAPFYTGFSSGSEGEPKGFCRHEHSWLASFETDAMSYTLSLQDSVVCPGKLAHSLFLYASLRALTSGIRVCFIDGLSRLSQRKLLQDTPSAVLFAVPAQLQCLLHSPAHYPKLRLLVSAGAKLQPSLRKALAKVSAHTDVIECYGSSELSYIALSLPTDSPPADSVGKPCPGVELRISNAEGRELPPGASGRITVRSPLRFIGYAEANGHHSLRAMGEWDGFLDSGDTGYLDTAGFLYVTGRSDRMMQIGGHSVFPEQLEAVLLAHPKITAAAVFAVRDARREQKPIAVIQCVDNTRLDRAELLAHSAQTLPKYGLAKQYYHCKDWPRTVSDKTDTQALIRMFENHTLEPIR